MYTDPDRVNKTKDSQIHFSSTSKKPELQILMRELRPVVTEKKKEIEPRVVSPLYH